MRIGSMDSENMGQYFVGRVNELVKAEKFPPEARDLMPDDAATWLLSSDDPNDVVLAEKYCQAIGRASLA